MTDSHKYTTYPVLEERINVYSHALGLVLSSLALVLLTRKAHGMLQVVSVLAFAAGLIVLYGASTLYHGTTDIARRARLRIVDHAMIYVLIAGTYTPFSLLVLKGTVSWLIFSAIWAMAAIGIIIKLSHTGRYDNISTAMYVFMGWVIVFAIKPLIENFSTEGLAWLFAGGISYTIGALFYSIKRMPFNHASFHLFCLLGSSCHFVSIYYYVLTPG